MSENLSNQFSDEKVNILIVDDRPDKLLVHETVLSQLNQNLVRATSGKEALRCLLKQDFAVILLDVNMPGMDGFETAAMIRQRPRSEKTPIIFISAVNDTDTHVSRGYSLGAVDYILTPVVPEILRTKIAVFVDLYKKTEQVRRQAEEREGLIREQAALAEAESRQERLRFLADAANVLAGSLDYHTIFRNLANLVVPRFADLCIVYSRDKDDTLSQLAIARSNRLDMPALRRLVEEFPSSSIGQHTAKHAVETGKTFFFHAGNGALEKAFDSQEERQLILSFKTTSLFAVPLKTHNRILGAIVMVTGEGRMGGTEELTLAEELAERAALALDNARLYQAAQDARSEAERANLAKDSFLAMLSHELRTPLTPVLTSVLSLQQERNLSPETTASIEMIHRNVELEARLIDDLLDLTRISKGMVRLNLEKVDAHLLLRSALEICDADIAQKNLVIETDFAAEKVFLEADPARLQQVFWNLIKNAVKFTPAGGRIGIRTRNDEEQLRVEVSDSGMGIDPEMLPKIFNAFEQGERPHFGGLGLGLAISKALVETHNGTLIGQSAGKDQGATFIATFPLTEDQARTNEANIACPPAPRKPLRVLLVEDHEDTNISLTRLLRRSGYYVQPAGSVKSALQLAENESFDALVSDIGLPDGNGFDLMQAIKARCPIFGIALTGFGMEEDVRKSQAVGFHHHLIKPVDLDRLDALLQRSSTTATDCGLAV